MFLEIANPNPKIGVRVDVAEFTFGFGVRVVVTELILDSDYTYWSRTLLIFCSTLSNKLVVAYVQYKPRIHACPTVYFATCSVRQSVLVLTLSSFENPSIRGSEEVSLI